MKDCVVISKLIQIKLVVVFLFQQIKLLKHTHMNMWYKRIRLPGRFIHIIVWVLYCKVLDLTYNM